MAEQYIFNMHGVNKHYGQKHVLRDINLSFFPGAKIGIVGTNGSGKSTVLRIMAGLDKEFQGHAEITEGFKACIVEQEPQLDPNLTVLETLELAFADTKAILDDYNKVADSLGEISDDDLMQKAMDKMGVLQDKIDALDAWNLDQILSVAANALCLPENERTIDTLSGGEKRRVALCKALLEKPDLLLLDEPTNHLDPETVDWLEIQLRDYPGTVIVVTHDRYFLDNITKWILELDKGHGIPWEGNYTSWLEQKLKSMLKSEKADNSQSKNTLAKTLEKELSWIKMSQGDRHQLARDRVEGYEQLVARGTAKADQPSGTIRIAPGPDLGSQVIEFANVAMGYDDNQLYEKVDFAIPRSAVVGLVGPNGAGKSTMFKMMTGDLQPQEGEVKLGSTVKLTYADQERAALDNDVSLIQEIGGGAEEIMIGTRKIPIRQYLAQFGFSGGSQSKMANELSGGERNRCHLAKIFKDGGNVLLLDEPTNDLDVNTLRLLEEAILDFAGCVLVISHDRFFLDRVCTHLIVFEGAGKVRWYEGNFSEYQDWRKQNQGDQLFQNRRSKYRTIVKA